MSGLEAAIFDFMLPVRSHSIAISSVGLLELENIPISIAIVLQGVIVQPL